MNSLFDLTGETAVVIGASGVLGGAMAEALAGAGAKVALVGRSREKGMARRAAIVEAGGVAEFFAADATDRSALEALEKSALEALGPATILVNAAGGNDPKATVTAEQPFESLTLEAWEDCVRLNLVGGALVPCQVFGPGMVSRRKGSIINIASVAAHVPLSRVAAYAAAKAAVLNLTGFLAREWAPFGVRVNSITPGFFPADQNRRLLYAEDGTPTPRAKAILGHTPMARFGEAHELAGAVVFLASQQAASFVTGIDVAVDGGFLRQTI